MTDEAQPSGQGETGSAGLFDSYLESVPEEYREVTGTYLADAAKQVNSRLEEAAALRNTYEPLSKIDGLGQYQPDDLQQLVQWHQQVTANEEAYKQFVLQAAQEQGLLLPEQQPETPTELTPDSVASLIEERTAARLAPVEEQLQQYQQQQWVAQEAELISSRISELERTAGVTLDEEQREEVLKIAESLAGEDASLQAGQDWITPGFDLYQKIMARGATGFVDDKTKQPTPALSSGGTAVHELPKTFEEAKARAIERLRQSRS